MNRRRFLISAQLTSLLPAVPVLRSASTSSIRLQVHSDHIAGPLPPNFTGLGYEISSVAIPNLLTASNHTYVQLVRSLGTRGVIRIGGNTSDDAFFSPQGTPKAASTGTVITERNLRDLATFLRATGWELIWGLNLGSGTAESAAAEAKAVHALVGDKLLAFEIGNEPDLFRHNIHHRPKTYGYHEYLDDYRRYKAVIRRQVPDAPFAGPDAATADDWVARFAASEGSDLKLLTHHYYRECQNAGSTLDKLLHPDPKLQPMLQSLQAASASTGVPYRICETNSFCGGGKPGVSDTFGAALWVLDFMLTLADAGCSGVNIETGINQLDFVSSYSPIANNAQGHCWPTADYYGMLAFAQASDGDRVRVEYDTSGMNLRCYATRNRRQQVSVAIVNKDSEHAADVLVSLHPGFHGASLLRLSAPSLNSKDGVTLGGSSVSEGGSWKPTAVSKLRVQGGTCEVTVPSGTAAIVRVTP